MKSITIWKFLQKFDARTFHIAAQLLRGGAFALPSATPSGAVAGIANSLDSFAEVLTALQTFDLRALGVFADHRGTILEVLRQVGVYEMGEDDLSWAERSSRDLFKLATGKKASR